jgi:hypothetical protein
MVVRLVKEVRVPWLEQPPAGRVIYVIGADQ